MVVPPPELIAAMRAMCGESDLNAVRPALGNWGLARMIALAPDAHPLVRVVAALYSGLSETLDPQTVADPTLHGVIRDMIGTPDACMVLGPWSHVAPDGWGRAHAAALMTSVLTRTCNPGAAAALIGPCDASSALLHDPGDIAFAIRRWGRSIPDDPTAWTEALGAAERERLCARMRSDPSAFASCLPWLPPSAAIHALENGVGTHGAALSAFADASSVARARHAAILQRLVDHAEPKHLGALTRLACAMGAPHVWRRVQTLIRASPDDARRVVAAAPWDDLPEAVHAAILKRANRSSVCAAVCAARGQRDSAAMDITQETAVAFFAALDPRVWDALDVATQQRLRHTLDPGHAHLAVRALGLRPEILARALLDSDLVHAAWVHARDAATLRAALFPIALRDGLHDHAHALIAALPTTPPNPGAFFCVAGGGGDPRVIARADAMLRRPADLAAAVTLQRCADAASTLHAACTALADLLHGRSHDDVAPILALLTDDARAALMPDDAALARRLAHPDRLDTLRQALARLAALPPEVAIPVRFTLNQWAQREESDVVPDIASDTAAAVAFALRDHGDVLLVIADALADDRRAVLLPLTEDAALANALRAMMRDHPPTAQRLAHAIRTQDRRAALAALLAAAPAHADAVWSALAETDRCSIVDEVRAETQEWTSLAERDPIAALALAALHADDADLHDAGVTALAARSGHVRAIWGRLSPKVQQTLGAIPGLADLSQSPARPARQRVSRR